ncbi:unnamed protein product [Somion occarium]|uniref:Chromatin modification-related protein n=1 Tax=Somion occarium TaxID=3059160 RepID=A0ABP1DA28_9APHY
MPRKGTKRRRSVAFPEVQESNAAEVDSSPEKPIDITDDAEDAQNQNDNAAEDNNEDCDSGNTEKEQEIWDTFREEYFEVLEQLPLSLHRSYALILELDQQVHDYTGILQTALRKYITKRNAIAAKFQKQPKPSISEQVARVPEPAPDAALAQESADGGAGPLEHTDNARAASQVRQPSVPPPLEEPPENTRELLTTIARTSEGVVRASSEKVNVARHAYDLIDRYIRDLDRAIKEEETSLSVGLRPGTHPASIILPEVVVPSLKGARAPRLTQTPVPEELQPEIPALAAEAPKEPEPTPIVVEETTSVEPTSVPPPALLKRKIRTSKRVAEAAVAEGRGRSLEKPPEEKEPTAAPVTRSLKLTVPPLASVAPQIELPTDPNEPRYCYCNQVSYGQMIACDNEEDCKIEWFHLGCVGVTRPPKGKWYCRDCAPRFQHSKKKSR